MIEIFNHCFTKELLSRGGSGNSEVVRPGKVGGAMSSGGCG